MSTRLRPVPVGTVRVTGGFLGERVRVNREVTLPIEYQQCQETGRLGAWDWQPGQPHPPHIFWDSDVAKWIEAAACSLAVYPDPELEARIDAVVARMAQVQLPDGYLNSHFILVEPGKRWRNLRDQHELYCAGHLIEAAVAYHEATGKRQFLEIMARYADHIGTVFGREAGQRRGYPGHEEIELALVKLYRATGERRYLDLATYFVDERGTQPHYYDQEARERGEDPARWYGRRYDYLQAHLPVREQATAEGHSVRACYLYSGMVDVAVETGDAGLLEACRRLWRNLTRRRLYLTGAVGSAADGERFTVDYDLPDEGAYAETCATIAVMFFAHRLLQVERDREYADVMEQALYNGVLSGVSQDGTRFFYANPLAVYPQAFGFGLNRFPAARQPWFGCACCPPNLARLLASLGSYLYSSAPGEVWVHLYAAGSAELEVSGVRLQVTQETDYPWDGRVALGLRLTAPASFTLALRLPGWCEAPRLTVNGAAVDLASAAVQKGYVHLSRTWVSGDRVELELPMPVRRVEAHPAVRQAAGRVALQRGPVVYCLEEADNGTDLHALSLPRDAALAVGVDGSPWPGVPVIRGLGRRRARAGWDDRLYATVSVPEVEPAALVAVPYCLWANRQVGEMRVWLREG